MVTAHPIAIESDENGFNVGYSVLVNTTDVDYQFAPLNTIQVGIAGLTATNVSAHSYGDWTFSAKKEYGNASLIATTGHGLPYTFLKYLVVIFRFHLLLILQSGIMLMK